jgi:3-dehydroquinate synthetase
MKIPAMPERSHHVVHVGLADRAYDVVVGEQLLTELGPRTADVVRGRRAFVIVDDNLPKALTDGALASLESSGFTIATASVKASESNKTIDTTARLLHAVAQTRQDRDDPIIAIGGGVTGDVAGFVAATYRRGVPIVHCPTTLLAMVDASVGGKTGVNLMTPTGLKKNLVGAFWQPALVLADVASLASLSERHLRAGLAECLKHGLIAASGPGQPAGPGDELFRWTVERLIKLRMGDSELLEELIATNVAVKAAFVVSDEREESRGTGGRALLNLGHTFGHAIETIPHLTPDGRPDNAPLHHGEAVAFGLVAAAYAGEALGRFDGTQAEAVRVAVERMGLESRLMGLPSDEAIVEAMMHDKKVRGGRLRIVVPTGPGTAEVVESPPEDVVRAGIDAMRIRR